MNFLSSTLRPTRRAMVLAALCAGPWPAAQALELDFRLVVPGVYAHIGELGGRSYENEGLNANLGLVVTSAGALLIDSGASAQSARKIHDAVRAITTQPLRWVINTGGQDHRWLGNGYFQSQGVQVIAHASARADMMSRGGDQLEALRPVLKEKFEGTRPSLPDRSIDQPDARLDLGATRIELRHRGGGHTPGDMMVWLPQANVLFSGDIVYVQRLLSVLPISNTKAWLASFRLIEELGPSAIVPGHGRVTTLAEAQADTRDYLLALRGQMKKAVDEGMDPSAAVKSMDASRFMRLHNAAELHPGNASRTYLEIERE